MQIRTFDRQNTKAMQDALTAHLQAFAAEWGCSVISAGGTIEGPSATLKVKFTAKSEEAAASVSDTTNRGLEMLGIAIRHGDQFLYQGTPYTVSGCNLGAPRFPVIADRADGRRMKFSTKGLVAIKPSVAA